MITTAGTTRIQLKSFCNHVLLETCIRKPFYSFSYQLFSQKTFKSPKIKRKKKPNKSFSIERIFYLEDDKKQAVISKGDVIECTVSNQKF